MVYKIACNDCDATYVGETERKLKGIRNTIKMSYSAKNGNDKNEIKAILI